MSENNVDYLVCQLADHPLTVAGSTFDRECCECHRHVMIAPSGQARLAAEPHRLVICIVCILPKLEQEPADTEVEISLGDLETELKRVIWNMRRHRN
jgi:hypothetical protein